MEAIEQAWEEALLASTYYRTLRADGSTHDDFWRTFAAYDRVAAAAGYPGALAARIGEQIPPGSRVVDVGAGTGAFTLPLARTAAEVVAVDPSSYHLEILGQKANALGLGNVRCLEALWGPEAARAAGPVDYAVAAYSFIDPDLRGFLATMRAAASAGIFLVYRAGGPDPLDVFVRGKRKSIGYRYLVGMLEAMGAAPAVEFFPRAYRLPLDTVLEKYRDGPRTSAGIVAFLEEAGRLSSSPEGGTAVRFAATDALVTVRPE